MEPISKKYNRVLSLLILFFIRHILGRRSSRKPLCRVRGKKDGAYSKELEKSVLLYLFYVRKKVVSCFVRPSSCQSQDLPDTLENPKYDSVFYSTIRSFGVTSVVLLGHSVL
jgi:hypothetical protein